MHESTSPISIDHHIIAVDWGSTNFRAYLINQQGLCIDSVSHNDGVLNIQERFETILQQHIGHWLNDSVRTSVMLFGMVGSQVGWVETPYVECPVNMNTFGQYCHQITSFNHGNCWIIPGVKTLSYTTAFDVMRGEEVQVIGAYLLNKATEYAWYCCPGTHNKWVTVNDGHIKSISTAMTGEIYAVLKKYSILAHSINEQSSWCPTDFMAGIEHSKRSGGLLNHLFSVRTNVLSEKHSLDQGAAYLSGLLIGHEIQSLLDAEPSNVDNPCLIIGTSALCQTYSQALTYFNVANKTISAQSCVVEAVCSLFNSIKRKE